MSRNVWPQYETDVRVPFFARGPGIPGGIVSDYQATMVDLPATILSLAGVQLPWPMLWGRASPCRPELPAKLG